MSRTKRALNPGTFWVISFDILGGMGCNRHHWKALVEALLVVVLKVKIGLFPALQHAFSLAPAPSSGGQGPQDPRAQGSG